VIFQSRLPLQNHMPGQRTVLRLLPFAILIGTFVEAQTNQRDEAWGHVAHSVATTLVADLTEVQKLLDAQDLDAAYYLLLRATRRSEENGQRPSQVATLLNNLGSRFQDLERYTDAEYLYKASTRTWSGSFGENDIHVSTPLNNLASLYLHMGQPNRSAPVRLRAIAIRTSVLGPEDPGVARLLSNLAADFFAARKYRQSEIVCQEALSKLPNPNLERALALHTLAGIRGEAKDFREGLDLVDAALEILSRVLPTDTTSLAECLVTKASLLHGLGRDDDAELTIRRSLALLNENSAPNRRTTIAVLRQYAVVLKSVHRSAEARVHLQRASVIALELRRSNRMQYSVSVQALAGPKK
jgi:tetratricopeptide (TPR) repeat protein